MENAKKSVGVTDTERLLADFCDRSFLRLWSYANPYKEDGKELCDLLAAFGDYVFIFFDREKSYTENEELDPHIAWDRWKRRAIDRQVVTAHGAERYIRSGRGIFLDKDLEIPFPLSIDPARAKVHKIVVAHGAKDACIRHSDQNVYGSLAIAYCDKDYTGNPSPFLVEIDRTHPIHIFDSENLSIIFEQLDTISDFSRYLDEKISAISKLNYLSYCGEEDLLASYLLNYDSKKKKYAIGSDESITGLMIGEGEWKQFSSSPMYIRTKQEDAISYLWDELIQRTCQNAINGTLMGNSDLWKGPSAIIEMVKEPRLFRRALSSTIQKNILNFPRDLGASRHVSLMPSFNEGTAYVFLQVHPPEKVRQLPNYRQMRQGWLEIACGAAKNSNPSFKKIVGIGMNAPMLAEEPNSEDFLLMPCEEWNSQTFEYYRELNSQWKFFQSDGLQKHEKTITQFVQPDDVETADKNK